MAGVNFAVLVGNVGADPEIRTGSTGNKVARFSIATSEVWTDKNTREKKERTEWHSVIVFSEGLVGVVEKYVRKGSRLFVRGQIRTRKWQDNSGQDRWTTEIHLSGFDALLQLLDKAGTGRPDMPADDGYGRSPGSSGGGNYGGTANQPFDSDLDDDVPF